MFSHHSWINNSPLCSSFERLCLISNNKHSTVAEMRVFSNGVVQWNWNWRRRIFVWENNMLLTLQSFLSNAQIEEHTEDSWCWSLERSGKYSVSSAYSELPRNQNLVEDSFFIEFWCKITSFAWKAMQDRIPTRVNLI